MPDPLGRNTIFMKANRHIFVYLFLIVFQFSFCQNQDDYLKDFYLILGKEKSQAFIDLLSRKRESE